ncbi:MAG: hypothetical protein U1E61_15770 [Bradyrhizobium sp.]
MNSTAGVRWCRVAEVKLPAPITQWPANDFYSIEHAAMSALCFAGEDNALQPENWLPPSATAAASTSRRPAAPR